MKIKYLAFVLLTGFASAEAAAQMPTDKDKYAHTFPNGNTLILKGK